MPPIEVGFDPESGAIDPYNRRNTPRDGCDDDDDDHDDKSSDNNKNRNNCRESIRNSDEDKTDDASSRRKIATPFVDLPIGATEDRVLGSIDFSATLKSGGKPVFSPGLLAAANRGILYIDEVNLLPAHLVDVLLDAAASGVNTIQREGMTMSHPARFVLIGTMNPEEGELRPQLLDRFGLMCDVMAPNDARKRVEVVRQRIAFERDPGRFRETWQEAEKQLSARIRAARDRMPQTIFPEDFLLLISEICVELGVASLRADITMYKTATALAAWDGRSQVEKEDIRRAAGWVLTHRKQHQQPFGSQPQSSVNDDNKNREDDRMEQLLNRPPPKTNGDANGEDQNENQEQRPGNSNQDDSSDAQDSPLEFHGHEPPPTASGEHGVDERSAKSNASSNASDNGDDGNTLTFTATKPEQIKRLRLGNNKPTNIGRTGLGKRTSLPAAISKGGRYTRSAPTDTPIDLALDATLRASAANGLDPDTGLPIILPQNWRKKVRESTPQSLVLFVVDASGSMSARRRMEAVKGAVLALLNDAYQQRDRVGVIAVRGPSAEILLEPTTSVELAERKLRRLPTGGRTPLAHALVLAHDTIHKSSSNESETVVLLVVLSDGKANVPLPGSSASGGDAWAQTEQAAATLSSKGVPTLFLDTDAGLVRVGRGKELADLLRADYLRLEDLSADGLVHTIQQVTTGVSCR